MAPIPVGIVKRENYIIIVRPYTKSPTAQSGALPSLSSPHPNKAPSKIPSNKLSKWRKV